MHTQLIDAARTSVEHSEAPDDAEGDEVESEVLRVLLPGVVPPVPRKHHDIDAKYCKHRRVERDGTRNEGVRYEPATVAS